MGCRSAATLAWPSTRRPSSSRSTARPRGRRSALPSTTMPTDEVTEVLDHGPNHRRQYRPAESRPPRPQVGLLSSLSRVGYLMRFVAGVDERLMDKVSQERSWYTSM